MPLGTLTIHADDKRRNWLADVGGICTGGWQPTPEAAVVQALSKARARYNDLLTQPFNATSNKELEEYRVLCTWFGS